MKRTIKKTVLAFRRRINSLCSFNDSPMKHALGEIADKVYGHEKSKAQGVPIDAGGNPLPWFTYPAIEYLGQLDLKNKAVLEWGCGYSSLYFCQKAERVCSVDDNEEWVNLIKSKKPENLEVFVTDEKSYAWAGTSFKSKFDIIVIDGIRRDECAEVAPDILQEGGMIIFDNADRSPEICKKLRNRGFLQVDLHGFGPINDYTWTTTIFFSRSFDFMPAGRQPIVPLGGGF